MIDRKELHQALLGFGFSLPSEMVKKLEKRFSPPPAPGGNANRGISFDRFLMACVTVKHYTEAFRRVDTRNEGRLTLDYNQFVSDAVDPWTGKDRRGSWLIVDEHDVGFAELEGIVRSA